MKKIIDQHTSFFILISLLAASLFGLGLGYLIFRPASHSHGENHTAHVPAMGESIWTCSMHPQIRQNEAGDCPICGMDLIPLEENTSSDPTVLEMTPEAVKLAQIETSVIGEKMSSEKKLILSGKIRADERRVASQVAHIPGRIEKLYVTFEGESVRKGQKIANVYSPELITAQQELIQALKLKESNPGLFTASRQKLSHWKLTDTQIERIIQDGTIQETFDIYADASGIVNTRSVAIGDYVKQGEVLFGLINLNRVWVLFDAYEEDLAKINIGDPILFSAPAIPGQTFQTRISFIDPVIDPASRVASVRGEVTNIGRVLKPEMFIRGELNGSPSKTSTHLLVPNSAVLWTGQRSVVYIKVPNMSIPSFRYQEVELGERMGNHYLVQAGLQAGDEVVTYGSFSIDAAAQLNNQQSMMNRSVRLEGHERQQPSYIAETPETFKEQLGMLSKHYLSLKDALVANDSIQSIEFVKEFLSELNKVDMQVLSGEAHEAWMTQLSNLTSHGQHLSSSSGLEEQRNQFSYLSEAMIESIQTFGIRGDTLYVQHCPMALDFEGANWLSAESNIINPYFGDEMLTCGTVTSTLAPASTSSTPNSHSSHHH